MRAPACDKAFASEASERPASMLAAAELRRHLTKWTHKPELWTKCTKYVPTSVNLIAIGQVRAARRAVYETAALRGAAGQLIAQIRVDSPRPPQSWPNSAERFPGAQGFIAWACYGAVTARHSYARRN
jgi:hypothetical protein